MIEINLDERTMICPYCGCKQTLDSNTCIDYVTYKPRRSNSYDINIYHVLCHNLSCRRMIVFCIGEGKQWDLIPENAHKVYPEYIPEQIRNDYKEAALIIDKSPKASATLLRRCLQGMIRDFWGIRKSRLIDEIDELNGKVTPSQWKAIDAIRKIGNIGAHMEKDVNLIIDIGISDAIKLKQLIELLIEKWYINKHEEETLYNDIVLTSDEKVIAK